MVILIPFNIIIVALMYITSISVFYLKHYMHNQNFIDTVRGPNSN